MFRHYILAAFRNAWRHRVTTAVNIAGLAVGLTFFVITYSCVAIFENGERNMPHSGRIYFVSQQTEVRGKTELALGTPAALAAYLRTDYPGIEYVSHARSGGAASVVAGTRKIFTSYALADAQFLRIFALPFLQGDARTALDRPNSVVVTRQTAQNLFGSTDIVGKTVLIGDVGLTVTGVLDWIPGPTHMGPQGIALGNGLGFDTLVSIDVAPKLDDARNSASQPWKSDGGYLTYLRFHADGTMSPETLNREFPAFVRRHVPTEIKTRFEVKPISALTLSGDPLAMQFGVSLKMLALAFGSIILSVACVNYANLATAVAVGRAKEIGLRKVLGAQRSQLIRQYLFESALHTSAALIIALIAVALLLPIFDRTFNFPVGPFLMRTPAMWIAILILLCTVSVLAGSYPAIVAARAVPASALRNSGHRRHAGFGLKLLVALQFAIGSFLLVVVIVMQMQKSAFLGLRPVPSSAGRIVVVAAQPTAEVNIEAFEAQLRQSSHITGISATDDLGVIGYRRIPIQHTPYRSETPFQAMYRSAAFDFFEIVGTKLMAGRTFSRERNDAPPDSDRPAASPARPTNIVIDAALAAQLHWSPSEAVGKSFFYDNDPAQKTRPLAPLTIIGVVENRTLAIAALAGAGSVYMLPPLSAAGFGRGNLLVRIRKSDAEAGLADIDAAWARLAHGMPIDRQFLDESLQRRDDLITDIIFSVTAFVACGFFISISGLIGVAVHVASRRSHEIGIRKVLGSTTAGILRLLLASLTRPVIIGTLMSWPLAYLTARGFLYVVANPVPLTPLPFLLSLVVTVGIGALAIAVPTWRAARVNPADVLHYE